MRALLVGAAILSTMSVASAADLPVKAIPPVTPTAVSNWTGTYVGGFVGGDWANLGYVSDPTAGASGSAKASGVVGGAYAGYDYELSNKFVLGAKVSVPFGSVSGSTTVFSLGPPGPTSGRMQWATNINGTIGYDMARWMPYVGVGVAFLSNKITLDGTQGPESDTKTHTGLNLLVGAKFMVATNWAVGLQYNHTQYGNETYNFPANFDTGTVKLSSNAVVGTFEYRF